ncbi:universal stress protein [Natrarchaeobius oligotrophus]|uniref:Universal stress protein n=1 Tax=Natrarchaeobius chitinivorans TaxID=1679083 RepID=A0A3N6P9N5_NATCH|nr:universal stress protein [Natrarchaeobius chitinivorans]RQG95649.1 universal stress protein [Natrarchaeobius chitinivorans]
MYTDVLLATDGSDCARDATAHAIDIATTYDATLHALYVIETRIGYDSGIIDPEMVERKLRSEGEAILDEVESAVRDRNGEVVSTIRRGIPEREIVDYVEEQDIDLVVLGVRGRSEFKTVLLGSTSETVVRELSIPVVLMTESDPDGVR